MNMKTCPMHLAAAAAMVVALATPISSMAQSSEAPAAEEKESLWSFSAGADLVSTYMWRGIYSGGASFQPALGVSCGPVTLGAWGSESFDGDSKEVDLALSFEKGGFSAVLTDYFFPGSGKYFDWDKETTAHQLELGVAYDFGAKTKCPLALSWSTMLGGADLDEDGDRMFSSYLEFVYSKPIKAVDLEVAAGFTPFDSFYQDGTEGFNMINLSIKGTYTIEFTEKFSLPVFAQLVLNPNQEDIHMVFGMSF